MPFSLESFCLLLNKTLGVRRDGVVVLLSAHIFELMWQRVQPVHRLIDAAGRMSIVFDGVVIEPCAQMPTLMLDWTRVNWDDIT